MLISVILATYNRPKALDRVLHALNAQDDHHYEVIIGDDGSRDDTRHLIDSWIPQFSTRLEHCWQEDTGFRLAQVRNLAVSHAKGDYLIFLDGDCVPRKHFISSHRRLAEKGWFVAGNRVLVSESFTHQVENSPLCLEDFTLPQMGALRCSGGVNRMLPLLDLPIPNYLRKINASQWQKIRGCNFAAWTSDFYAINGFDEAFQGWGFEDSDFYVRLINHGVRRKLGNFATGVYHLYHKENDRNLQDKNFAIVRERLANHSTAPSIGIIKK